MRRKTQEGARTRRANPISATRDVLDTIMEDLKRDAALEDKNVWSPGFLKAHV